MGPSTGLQQRSDGQQGQPASRVYTGEAVETGSAGDGGREAGVEINRWRECAEEILGDDHGACRRPSVTRLGSAILVPEWLQ